MSEQLPADFGSSPSSQLHNLFFAILPGPEVIPGICDLGHRLIAAHRSRGTMMAAARMHVTLCAVATFSGDSDRWQIAEAKRVAETIAAETPAFDVTFNRVVGFANANGAKLALCRGGELNRAVLLQHRLRSALRRAGMRSGGATLSRPHLTLVYNAGRAIDEHPIVPISWHVREFALIDSLHGRGRHVRLGSWRLRD